MFLRKCFLAFLFFNAITSGAQSDYNSLQSIYNQINKSEKVDTLMWGFCLIDSSGRVVSSYNANKLLTPASIVKALTTSLALERLSPDFRFQTTLGYTGSIDALGNLSGDLIIIGSGDPTFAAERFDNHYLKIIDHWTDKIKMLGIKSISGNIVIDNSLYPKIIDNPNWDEDDVGNYYGASPSGFMFNENAYRVQFNKGKKGDSASIKRIEPMPFNCRIETDVIYSKAGSGDNVIIFSHPKDTVICIYGTIPEAIDNFSIKGALPNPELTFACVFKDVLQKSNIRVKGIVLRSKPVTIQKRAIEIIDTLKSPNLASIVKETNLFSINIYAESILHQLGKQLTDEASSVAGLRSVKTELSHAGIDTSTVFLYDGNGLSRKNALTAAQFAQFMHYVKRYATNPVFVRSLPVGGMSGGMKNILTGPKYKGRVFAKTGYMEKVRCFTGYVDAKTKGRVTFCLMFNNYSCSIAEIKLQAELLFNAIVDM